MMVPPLTVGALTHHTVTKYHSNRAHGELHYENEVPTGIFAIKMITLIPGCDSEDRAYMGSFLALSKSLWIHVKSEKNIFHVDIANKHWSLMCHM